MRVLTWLHGPAFATGAVAVIVNRSGLGPLWYTGAGLLLFGLIARWLSTRAQRPRSGAEPAPVAIGLPLAGRWTALNGPETKVPSHTHALAQTYAIDLVLRPAPDPVWFLPIARRPDAYPAFGAPLLAPADARVVMAADGQRDHLTRTSLPGLLYLFLEGFVRSLGRPRHLLGNHVVLDLGDGVHAVYAHARRGSLRVAPGDRVVAGQPLAECGNSGNSSEPHLHFQLMDGPDIATAHGLRFTWRYQDGDGVARDGVPADGSTIAA
ncbi:M23 family metallopeptidase [Jiangella endophytica]|uniref:M23 family metallopeptidase n=1 Tax=Jiangella endophytica TaxID=1623398 RepID=UPI000E343668|nr:M23 family metallopeptidase [Jiangella endophytica]